MANPAGEYGLHLFFNEKEFVDVLTIESHGDLFKGHMHVPDDFDGDIKTISYHSVNQTIEFELFVPKNKARPQDLIFVYKGQYFDDEHKQLIGYVEDKQGKFIASFVAFKRK